ncbi:MAG TPA: Stp1/IreP family PP2C-type Ser/Thr phosphatase [Myxococcales bacterium]|nr:Stp1/IreP family PP2C-type Ser/Thr phosphatase [Myxococcales bacterium]HIK85173.1 Stp1/IreP family PP2C-type Ser/Thr phosphatase [Myxococcales bacterium]
MLLRSAASTHVGMCRRANEDRYAIVPDLGLYLVADGMGGHKAGQVASELATEAVIRDIEALQGANVSLAERLRHAVGCSNREIIAAASAKPELSGMGTTLVGLLFAGKRLALAHVGDSRAYLIRRGRLRGLTDDHSIVGELLRREEISEEDARQHPHRHVLTRALGVRPRIEPDLAEMTPQVDDVFILCSDGLTTHLEDEEIAQRVCDEPDLEAAAAGLVDAANRAGGADNTTVLLVRYEKED